MNTSKIVKAPEFNVKNWIDVDGNATAEIKLSDYKGKFKVSVLLSALVPRLS